MNKFRFTTKIGRQRETWWFLHYVMIGLMGLIHTSGAQAAASPPLVTAEAGTQWIRLLANRRFNDTEADAAGAVDGVKNADFGFHTDKQKNPWWQVDLQQVYSLDRVIVFNRSAVPERARFLMLLVSIDGQDWQKLYEHDGSIFDGPTDKKPLVISLKGKQGRFVRIQIKDDIWLHLSEVEVYGTSDAGKNLALHKPARQSSISQWSKRAKIDPTTIELGPDDLVSARNIIRDILSKAGKDGRTLQSELDRLTERAVSPNHSQWISLYTRATELVQKKQRILTQLALLDITALKRAIQDLGRTYPLRYPKAGEFLARLNNFEKDLPAIKTALAKGDKQARKRFEKMQALKRQALLSNPILDFDRIILIKRAANKLGLPANWQGNCSIPLTGYDNEIAIFSPMGTEGKLATLYRPQDARFVGDVDLNFDADKMIFSMSGSHDRWQIWEIGSNSKDLRQVTRGTEPDVDNYDACYLPDGRIIYDSTAPMTGVPCVRGSSNVANLYIMDNDGMNVRQLCFDQDHDWCPAVLNNGRVLYQRWEYTDTPHSNTRILFHMNPDGTAQMEYYGSNSYWPNSIFYARPIPNHPTQVVGIVTGHHGVARMGELVIFDPAQNRHESSGVVQRIPGFGKKVEPVIKDQLVNDSWPKFLHPYPLSKKYFLVSCKPTPGSLWGIYLVDVFDNMLLLKEQAGYALLEPIAFRKTKRPPIVPDKVNPMLKDAIVSITDIYRGDGLKGIPRGTVKKLRIFSYNYSFRGMGGLLGTVGMDGPWDIKRVLGTVPVEEDGSANFVVPANTPISVQPLDAQGKALQVMRSWMTAMPGENLSCVGCHEPQNSSPPVKQTIASRRKPSKITPWYGPTRGFSFKREVQPVLDRYCMGCHNPESPNGKQLAAGTKIPDLRGTKLINDWSSVTPGNAGNDGGRFFSVAYNWLHRYVRRPGIESDYHLLTPMDFHADTTELVQMLKKGHHGVTLDPEAWDRIITWIDLNAPYHGYWHEIVGERAKILCDRQVELRARHAGPVEDLEYIPDIPVSRIVPVKPQPVAYEYPAVDSAQWPVDKETVKSLQAAAGKSLRSIELAKGITLELMRIPAGEFVMGQTNKHPLYDEKPCAVVNITKSFWIGRFEITNEQYRLYNPTHDSRVESKHAYQFGVHGFPLNLPQQPVVRVSWREAMEFCKWLSRHTGHTFSLPTEAQWEYACRAGSAKEFSFGDLEADFSTYANLADKKLREFADNPYQLYAPLANATRYDDWIPRDDRFNDGVLVSSRTGRYKPNAWGLYDMHGNVAEWTRTSYKPYPYRGDDGRNNLSVTEDKVVRGGSWYDRPKRARSAFRLDYRPYQKVFNVGFRVVYKATSGATTTVAAK